MGFWSSLRKFFASPKVNSVYSIATTVFPIVEAIAARSADSPDESWAALRVLIIEEASKAVHVDPTLLEAAVDIAILSYQIIRPSSRKP